MPAQSPSTLMWTKLTSSKWEDAWIERLQFLRPNRLAIFSLPGSRRIRLEAYSLTRRDAARLTTAFGGQLRKMKPSAALLAGGDATPPLLIRDRLVIVRSPRAARLAAHLHPARPLLVIPAAMAFGTGDHATTSVCLRLLCDLAIARKSTRKVAHKVASKPTRWEALDLGAGTGILALAARLLGAARCDAWDYDPACVRAIRDNARLNKIRNVPAARIDVSSWTPSRQWDLVTANLISGLLITVAPAIAAAVRPGGHLILSGMLASQVDETLAAFKSQSIAFQRIVKKGKWVTALGAPFDHPWTAPRGALTTFWRYLRIYEANCALCIS